MEFRNVTVNTGTLSQSFDFVYHEVSSYGQACTITSAGKTAIVDEDFMVIESGMPDHWLEATVKKVKKVKGLQAGYNNNHDNSGSLL